MILDLREFEEFPATTTIQGDPAHLKPFNDSVLEVKAIGAELAIQRAGQEFFCQGRVNARLKLECARCLGSFERALEGTTDFIICSEVEASEHLKAGDGEDYVVFAGNNLLVDMTEQVRQVLALELSLKPICSENCKGLCPSCGTDLNRQNCSCRRENTDPRWDGLKEVLPKQNEQ